MERRNAVLLFFLIALSASGLMLYALWKIPFPDPSFFHCIQYIFLDRDSVFGRSITPMADIYLFCLLLFSVLFTTRLQFGVSKKHRSLLLLRFHTKKRYVHSLLHNSFSSTILVVLIICTSLMFSFTLITGKSVVSGSIQSIEGMTFFLGLLFNQTLFLNLMAILNLLMVLSTNDLVALTITLFGSGLLLILDTSISAFCVLTCGSIFSILLGSCLLVTLQLVFNGLLFYFIRTRDIL